MASGTLVMIPVPLGDAAPLDTVPEAARRAFQGLDLLLVENERSARRYLSRLGLGTTAATLEMRELSEHTRSVDLDACVEAMAGGSRVGVVSEAGCPGIADPGAELARRCHERGIAVMALPGPSSVILAVMASGLGGQRFSFHGYLPAKTEARRRSIRDLERRARERGETQVFIEAPYRNEKLFADLVSACRPDTLLCVARDLTTPEELVRTRSVGEWRAAARPDVRKRPALFLIGSPAPSPPTV